MTCGPLSRRAFLTGTLAVAASLAFNKEATALSTPALFVAAHPDDETLAMGVAVAEHVAAGVPTHVLLLTDGGKSSARAAINGDYTSRWWRVRHDPTVEGYLPLSTAEFGAARVGECRRAMGCLGPVTIHQAGLPDGMVTQWAAVDAILAVADQIVPGGGKVWLKTHSAKVDNHPDHVAAGNAVAWLARQTRFATPRYYILPAYWADSRLSSVTEWWDQPTDTTIAARVVNACRAYGAWAPPNSYAVAWHSTSALFNKVMAAPKCLVHG